MFFSLQRTYCFRQKAIFDLLIIYNLSFISYPIATVSSFSKVMFARCQMIHTNPITVYCYYFNCQISSSTFCLWCQYCDNLQLLHFSINQVITRAVVLKLGPAVFLWFSKQFSGTKMHIPKKKSKRRP